MTKRKCVIFTKESYRQGGFSTGLIRILDGLDRTVRVGRSAPVTITSGSDSRHNPIGAHMSPRFEGIDLRSKTGFVSPSAKRLFLQQWLLHTELCIAVPDSAETVKVRTTDGRTGYKVYTFHLFGHLKDEGERNEHFHVQVRKGKTV